MPPLRRLSPLLAPHRAALLGLVASSMLLVAAEAMGLGSLLLIADPARLGLHLPALPWLSTLVAAARSASFATRMQWLALLLLLVTAVHAATSYAQAAIALRLRIATTRHLQRELLADVHRLPLSYVQASPSGSWNSFLVQNTRELGALVETAALALPALLTTLAYLVLALALSWRFTLLALLPLGLSLLALRPLVRTRLQNANQRMQARLAALGGVAQEQLAATKAVRVHAAQDWSVGQFASAQDAFLAEDAHAGRLMALSRPLFELFAAASFALILLAGTLLLPGTPAQRMAQAVLFLAIALRLLRPLTQLSWFLAQNAKAVAISTQVRRFHEDAARLAPVDRERVAPRLREAVEFRELHFTYPDSDGPALDGLSLRIERGRTTAIVGASGAGKSSLVNLLARLYDPDAGVVLVDGVDLRELQVASWRHQLAVVSQETLVFHADVWDNLRFARPAASREEIVHACTIAQAHEFIMALPRGYDTVLQEHGSRLSGGQRQRISLARALLADAELLVLDEATSELDTPTERALQASLAQVRGERTLVVIAHRLSAIVGADTIYVLEGGRVVEQGTHEQLLLRHGAYARLAQAPR
jgi:ABC-type multidrug transport system fused ATPase/permease subunit